MKLRFLPFGGMSPFLGGEFDLMGQNVLCGSSSELISQVCNELTQMEKGRD